MIRNLAVKCRYFVTAMLICILMISALGCIKIFAGAKDWEINLSQWQLSEIDENGSAVLTDYRWIDNLRGIIVPNATDFILSDPKKYANLKKVYITIDAMQSALGNANALPSGTLEISNIGTGDKQKVFAQGKDWSYLLVNADLISEIDFSNFDTSEVNNMHGMFVNCPSLKRITLGRHFNTENVEDMSEMFSKCTLLRNLELGPHFDTSKVKDMNNMFYECCVLNNLNLKNFNTSNVVNMRSMFARCIALRNLDIKSFDTSNVVDMSSMFSLCRSLTSIKFGDNFKTGNVKSMLGMFSSCENIEELNLSNFDVSNTNDMRAMFGSCYNLKKLDLSNFDMSKINVDRLYGIFSKCNNLTDLIFSGNYRITDIDFTKLSALNSVFIHFSDNNPNDDSTSNVTQLLISLQKTGKLKILKGYRDGCIFESWYTDENLTQRFDPDHGEIDNTTVLYAKWEKNVGTDNLDFDEKQKIATKEHLNIILNDMVSENNNNLQVIERVKEKLFEKYLSE